MRVLKELFMHTHSLEETSKTDTWLEAINNQKIDHLLYFK